MPDSSCSNMATPAKDHSTVAQENQPLRYWLLGKLHCIDEQVSDLKGLIFIYREVSFVEKSVGDYDAI